MKLVPYIAIKNDKGTEALKYYSEQLGMTITSSMKFSDMPEVMKDFTVPNPNAIMHAELEFNGMLINLSDDIFPSEPKGSPAVEVNILVDMDSSKEVDDFTNLVLKSGGKEIMPLQDTAWGARYALVTDKMGVSWHIHHQKTSA